MQGVVRSLKGKERALAELRKQFEEAERTCRDLAVEKRLGDEEVNKERRVLSDLHRQVIGFREACLVPAQLKRRSAALMRSLDQEGGRRTTEKRLRGLEAAAKLHRAVAKHAPALRPLAGRAEAGMLDEFARYRQLERRHAQLLQNLHASVARGVLSSGATTAAATAAAAAVHEYASAESYEGCVVKDQQPLCPLGVK